MSEPRTTEILERLKQAFRNNVFGFVNIPINSDRIEQGYGWIASYEFELAAGATAYLAFETGNPDIHARNRNVNVADLGNQIIDVKIETLANATIDTLGVDISENIINANLNLDNSIVLSMYDETTTVTSEGGKIPFSGTISGDRKQVGTSFISDEYVLKNNDFIVLKFVNNGSGNVRIEYNSNGYQYE